MKRRNIQHQTMRLVAGSLLRQLRDERYGGQEPNEHAVSISAICVAVAECGISAEALAEACATELGGRSDSSAIYDDLDRELAASLGDPYNMAFLEALAEIEAFFRGKGLPVY